MSIKSYIFLTDEGYTYQPMVSKIKNKVEVETQIENLQVIGFCNGKNADDAFANLLKENIYLKDTTFKNIFSFPLLSTFEIDKKYHVI